MDKILLRFAEKLAVRSQLKFFVLRGVPVTVISTPLFCTSPAFNVIELKPVVYDVDTGNICSLLFDLYQVKLKPRRLFKKLRSVPISNVVVFSGNNVGIP